MSKVNRRKEIKQKEDFQLKFQLALSANNDNVLKWLPSSHNDPDENQCLAKEKEMFLDLPVIPNGAGLSKLDKHDNPGSSQTIGAFLNVETMPRKQNTNTAREDRTGSKSMSALMNKMRTDSRKNIAERYQVNKDKSNHRPRSRILEDIKIQKQKQMSKPDVETHAPDSDEEESKMKQISGKKKFLPQFGKKGKGRPF